MVKKALSLILSLLICFGAMAVMPLAVSAEEVGSVDAAASEKTAEDPDEAEEVSPQIPSDTDLAETGASAEIIEEGSDVGLSDEGAQYGGWSSWSTTPAYASSTRQVETRRVIVSYDIEGNCCGNSSGQRCYLKYMQSGYTLRLHYDRRTVSASDLNSWARYAQGSYYQYASNVNGYIIGPGTAYIDPYQHVPYFIVAENYGTEYRYRDRVYTPISKCTVTLSQTTFTYDGRAKTPTVTVKYGSTLLRNGIDYTVSYRNNIEAGTASAIISGYDNFNGSVTKTFTIKKASGYALATPVITKLKSASAGVSITWGKVPGAAKYRVYLKTSAGWKKLCDTTSLSYIYTKVSSGTKYYFSVRCLSADAKRFTSDMNSTGWAITYFATPKIKTLANASNGVRITWSKVNKAVKYRVFLITSSGVKKLGDSTTTTFTHKAAKSGTKYKYTVCCITSDGSKAVSAYNTKGWAITYIAMPQFKSISYSASGHVLKWKKISGAPMYCVLIKSGGKWKALAYTTGTTYTYKKAKAGVKYTYSLRCVNKNKKAVSAYDTKGKSFKTLKAPTMKRLVRSFSSIGIWWQQVSGAKAYRVYYRTKSPTGSSSWSSWHELALVRKNEYGADNYYYHYASGGYLYQYRVRCVTESGVVLSGYSKNSSGLRFCRTPHIYRGCKGSGYLRFYWNGVSGASRYKVYIYDDIKKQWKTLGTTYSDVYYYYTNNTYGTHKFGLRAIDSQGHIMSELSTVRFENYYSTGFHIYTNV